MPVGSRVLIPRPIAPEARLQQRLAELEERIGNIERSRPVVPVFDPAITINTISAASEVLNWTKRSGSKAVVLFSGTVTAAAAGNVSLNFQIDGSTQHTVTHFLNQKDDAYAGFYAHDVSGATVGAHTAGFTVGANTLLEEGTLVFLEFYTDIDPS